MDVIGRALRERGAKGGECEDVGGRRAFLLSHRRKRHSFQVAVDDLVAWAMTLCSEVFSRCRQGLYHSTRLGYRLEKKPSSYREDEHGGLTVSPSLYPSYRRLWSICFIPEAGMELHTGHGAVALPLTKIAKSYVIRRRRSCSRQFSSNFWKITPI